MKKFALTIALILTVSTLFAQRWNSKKALGNGKIISKERTIPDFDALKVAGNFKVKISSEQSEKLSINTDENLMEYIITEVEDGTLKIRMKKNYYLKPSNHRAISIKVPMKALRLVTLSGSGSIHSDKPIRSRSINTKMAGSGKISLNVETQEMSANLSGSGRIELQGSSEEFEAKLAGSGSIRARAMEVNGGDFSLSGSGRMIVNVSGRLKAQVSGSGSIRYEAKPSTRVVSKVVGSGSIREIKSR